MVHTTRLRVKGIERSSRRTRYILPRTRKAPCANLLLLPLTETLRTNNDDDDNDNVETHTGGTVHAARCLSSPPHARSLASSTSLLCHRDTTKPENKQLPSRTRLVCRKARLFFTGRNSLSLRGKRGTQRENEGHTYTQWRARACPREGMREKEKEKERKRERQRGRTTQSDYDGGPTRTERRAADRGRRRPTRPNRGARR